ncbi:MAG TPA: hypothetical protein VFE13_19495, partial [Caulobacteraceae bacterium]|nr:hypothetical protein [Caulobacteraceae bacterium]
MTSKTISTTVQGYKFKSGNSSLTITATGKVTGNGDFSNSAVYASSSHANETVVNLGIITSGNFIRGVNLRDGGTVINGSATSSISGSDVGVLITGKAGTI